MNVQKSVVTYIVNMYNHSSCKEPVYKKPVLTAELVKKIRNSVLDFPIPVELPKIDISV